MIIRRGQRTTKTRRKGPGCPRPKYTRYCPAKDTLVSRSGNVTDLVDNVLRKIDYNNKQLVRTYRLFFVQIVYRETEEEGRANGITGPARVPRNASEIHAT